MHMIRDMRVVVFVCLCAIILVRLVNSIQGKYLTDSSLVCRQWLGLRHVGENIFHDERKVTTLLLTDSLIFLVLREWSSRLEGWNVLKIDRSIEISLTPLP